MKTSTQLLRWYKQSKRDLPWRKTRDPYKILVSEIMLQQTQVDRVIGFYKAWLKQFPDFHALAKAKNADVIHAWSGLGYNRRALALRDIAKQVVNQSLPQTRDEWIALKGIGPYTSAAIALFAQHERVFPIDSIIRRVGGRYYLGRLFPTPKIDESLEKKGLRLLQETDEYHEVPQALFDLGTKICKKEPLCKQCPLKSSCKAGTKFLTGTVKIPKRSIKKSRERIHRGKKYPDRIYRGKILQAIKESSTAISIKKLIGLVDKDYDAKQDKQWFESMLTRLEKDQMIRLTRKGYTLF